MGRLRELQRDYPCIGEVRGKGLMIGMELIENDAERTPARALCDRLVTRGFHNGLLLLSCGVSTLRFMPPLSVTDGRGRRGRGAAAQRARRGARRHDGLSAAVRRRARDLAAVLLRAGARARRAAAPWRKCPSLPCMSRAATSALTIASSVACTVATKSGSSSSLPSDVDCASGCAARAPPRSPSRRRRRCRPSRCRRSCPCARGRGAARRAMRFSWCGSSGASVAITTMIEPVSPCDVRVVAVDAVVAQVLADRHAGDAQRVAHAVVGLHQHADRVRSWPATVDAARGRADAALELVADHAGAAADVALGDRPAACRVERADRRARRVTWKPLMSFRCAVPGLGDDRQRPPVAAGVRRRRRGRARRSPRRARRRRCGCW